MLPAAKRRAAKAQPAPKRGRTAAQQRAAPAEHDDDATLQALLQRPQKKGLRPRTDENPPLLKEVVLGFKADEPDPVQSGETRECQSDEISRVFGKSPISKKFREQYVWLAKAEMEEGVIKQCFTMDADAMVPAERYEMRDQNTCDVCGLTCTEELYEFRCYERKTIGHDCHDRRLHPFISYISKTCGKGLLGVQSAGAKLRESVFRELLQATSSGTWGEEAQRKLEDWKKVVSQQMWRSLVSELEHFAGASANISDLELKRAESQIEEVGSLHRVAEDPFRALSRGTAPVVNSRDLALATVMMIRKTEQQPRASSYLERAAKSIEAGTPLPSASFLTEEDLFECLQAIVEVWPLRVELHTLAVSKESSNGRKSFVNSKGKQQVKDAALNLVYLSGAKQLHASLQDKIQKPIQQALRAACKELLHEATQKYNALRPSSSGGLSQGRRRAEDANVKVPEDRPVNQDDAENALLNIITWPDCKSRANVKPDGQDSIKAMCLGVIKPYFSGVCPSVNTRILQNVTRLCAGLAKAEILEKDFKYSSIQLNMNYSAKLHVDKNNYGPSYIIGLGNYSKGQLWILDPDGKEDFKVTTPLRGYPNIKVGDVVKGTLHDINHKWLKFNGHVPHGAVPYEGECRISLVYFSRKGSETINDEGAHYLQALGIPLPTDEWLEKIRQEYSSAGPVRAVKRPRLDGEAETTADVAAVSEEDSEDEVDEDEAAHMDADGDEGGPRLRAADWARRFREQLQVEWDKVPFSLGVSSFCAGLSAAWALQELLPLRRPRVLALVEDGDAQEAALRLAKQNLQVELAYKELSHFEKGKGFCDVEHKDGRQMPGMEEEDLFVGCFPAAPLVVRYGKKNYANDPKAEPLKILIRHLATRRPRLALLEATDWQRVHEGEQRGVLDFLLKDGPEGWSLGQLKDFNVEALEISLADVGLPSTEARLQLLLARKDAVSPERLRQAGHIARHLGAQLPRSSVQDLLLKDGDRNLEELRRTWVRPPGAKPPIPAAYTEDQPDAGTASWWNFATCDQQQVLNQVYKQAKATGLDIASLVVDLGQKPKNTPWSDSGLPCPAPGWAPTSQHYAFGRHRPLLGREELLCRGYPVGHLNLKGVGDAQLRALAYRLPALQATAAALCGLLAAADWKAKLQLPAGRFEELAAQGAKLAASALSANTAAPDAPTADHTVTNRAVVLLSLLNHGRFGNKDKDKDGSAGETTAAVPKKVVEALKHAMPDEEAPRGVPDAAPDLLAAKTEGDEDFQSWEIRRRKLNVWQQQRPPLRVDRVMRWIAEAALEPKTKFAEEILGKGIDYLMRCMDASGVLPAISKGRKNENPDALDKELKTLTPAYLETLLQSLEHAYGYEAIVDRLASQATAILFLKCVREKANKQMMLNGGMDISDYVTKVMKRLNDPTMDPKVNLEFLEHFAGSFGSLSEACKSKFADADGIEELTTMLQTIATQRATEPKYAGTWPKGERVLQVMLGSLSEVALRCKGLLRFVLQLAPLTKQPLQSAARVEEAMCQVICRDLEDLKLDDVQIDVRLADFKLAPDPFGQRIKATAGLLGQARGVAKQLEQLADAEPTMASQNMLHNLELALAQSCSLRDQLTLRSEWGEKLSRAEDALIQPVQHKLQARKTEVAEAISKKQREYRQRLNEERKLEDERRKMEAIQTAQQAAERLHGLMENSQDGARLEKADKQGFDALMSAARACVAAQLACSQLFADPGAKMEETMRMAKEASHHYCTRKARHARAVARLRELGFEKVLQLLEKGELLERLPELAGHGGSQLLLGLGLPPKARQLLLRSAQDGSFGPEHLTPIVPRGYNLIESKSIGLKYLQPLAAGGQGTFEWPVEPSVPGRRISEPDAPPELAQVRRIEEHAAYIVPAPREGPKKFRCLLCSCSASQDHLESGAHQHHLRIWRGFCSHVGRMAEDSETASYHAKDATPLEAWKQELLEYFQSREQGSDFQRILRWFWHLIVRPNWPSVWPELTEALRRMSNIAQLEEPDLSLEPPTPGECFPCFPGPAPKITEDTSIAALDAEELLMHGLMLQDDGKYRCWYCEVDVDNIEFHLNPHFKEAKGHHKYQEIWEEFGEWLRKDGWTLQAQGCTIVGQQFECGCGAKTDKAWNLIGEGGHLRTTKHQTYKAKLPTPSQDLEEKRRASWTSKIEDTCRTYLNRVRRQQQELAKKFPAKTEPRPPPAEPKAPKGSAAAAEAVTTPSAKVPRPPPQQAQEAAASRSSESPAPAASGASDEPPLPRPGKDFPDLSDGTGLEVKPNGTIWCHACSYEVPKGEKTTHPQTRRHIQYRTAALDAFKMVKDRGDTLWREGQKLEDSKIVCECGKSDDWWKIIEWHNDGFHSKTNWHQRWKRNYGKSLTTPRPWDAARRERWQQSWAQSIGGGSAASTGSASPAADADSAPASSEATAEASPAKRARREPPQAQAPAAKSGRGGAESAEGNPDSSGGGGSSGSSTSHAQAADVPIRAAPSAKGYPAPSEEDKIASQKSAENRYAPALPAKELRWGYFDHKRKDFYVWCDPCKTYVTCIKFNLNTGVASSEDGGSCPHYTPAVHAAYKEEMQNVLKKWG
eukprot:TRINITY_DN25823_c0_g1_i1.p1 TRINITY_DN25823_c0_g1~~TRINITY_DN25823_c0_g1_i1.p1  ORF type:complete len:2603 (-),score=588.26 TRINITY_DN25823_c0_g1_i1:172-7914(-)